MNCPKCGTVPCDFHRPGLYVYRIALVAVSLLGVLAACDLQRCSEGSVCTLDKSSGPSGIPTPSATPLPTASPFVTPTVKPESCAINYMTLRPVEGLVLPVQSDAEIDLTPYQTVTNPDGTIAQREVSKACNEPRASSVVWTSTSAAVVIGPGFTPTIRRVGIGVALVSASIEGHVSNTITIR